MSWPDILTSRKVRMVLKEKTALMKVTGKHKVALEWYQENKGSTVLWKSIQDFSRRESRLVNQAKGIYKPAYTDYALSIRTIQDGPYPDQEVEYRADGSWVFQYFQENSDPNQRDREATNRGLMKCMEDGIPIGALVKRVTQPSVAYEILGLGLVVDWASGFFTIEGFSSNGIVHSSKEMDATRLRATKAIHQEPFDAENYEDLREKTIAQIAKRRGQAAFRTGLLKAYGGKCCVTGCGLQGTLEAAHITPHRGLHSQNVQNGLLLRCDIHTLFDLGLVTITEDYCVKLSPVAMDHEYAKLDGVRLRLPEDPSLHPNLEALKRHRKWSGF